MRFLVGRGLRVADSIPIVWVSGLSGDQSTSCRSTSSGSHILPRTRLTTNLATAFSQDFFPVFGRFHVLSSLTAANGLKIWNSSTVSGRPCSTRHSSHPSPATATHLFRNLVNLPTAFASFSAQFVSVVKVRHCSAWFRLLYEQVHHLHAFWVENVALRFFASFEEQDLAHWTCCWGVQREAARTADNLSRKSTLANL